MKLISARTTKKRLLQLADLLDVVPSEHFNIGWFGSVERGEIGTDVLAQADLCGTTACALGWAPSLPFAKRLGYKLEVMVCRNHHISGFPTVVFTRNGREVSSGTAMWDLFGLTWKSGGRFVFNVSDLHPNRFAVTAHEAANAIRTFVAIRFG